MAKYLDMAGAQKIIDWAKRSFAKAIYTRDCISQDSEGYLDVKYDGVNIVPNSQNQLTLAKTYTEVVDSDGNVIDKVTLDMSGGKAVWSVNWDKHTVYGSASNGQFLSDIHYVSPGETVTIYNIPNDGYKYSTISVVPNSVTLTVAGTNKWTFVMPSTDVSIAVSNVAITSADTGKMYYYKYNHEVQIYNHYGGSNYQDISKFLTDGGNIYDVLSGYTTIVIKEPLYPTNASKWFSTAGITVSGLNYINLSKCTNTSSMFENYNGPLDISTFDFSKVKLAKNMFKNCSSAMILPDYLNFINCSDMTGMFEGSTITTCNLIGMDSLAKLRSMSTIFKNCTNLTSVFLPKTCNITALDATEAFYGCTALNTILCNTDWSTSVGMGNSNDMFYNCTSLPGYAATNPTNKTMAKPQSLGGYFDIY